MRNQDFVNRMLAKLADRLPHDLTRLEELIAKGDLAQAVPQAHAIKGMAANLSAERLHFWPRIWKWPAAPESSSRHRG